MYDVLYTGKQDNSNNRGNQMKIKNAPWGITEYRILKKYQTPFKDAENPFARWFTAAKSEATFGSWDYGDMYVRDIKSTGRRIK